MGFGFWIWFVLWVGLVFGCFRLLGGLLVEVWVLLCEFGVDCYSIDWDLGCEF